MTNGNTPEAGVSTLLLYTEKYPVEDYFCFDEVRQASLNLGLLESIFPRFGDSRAQSNAVVSPASQRS